MSSDETTWIVSLWQWIKSSKLVRAIFWARWLISLSFLTATLLWYAYIEGQEISENLSADYISVQSAQSTLIDDSLSLQQGLLNANVGFSLNAELDALRAKAKRTIGVVGGLRAPTEAIEEAKNGYKNALEQLIAVTNRLERGEIENMALVLHNSLQAVANAGGELNAAVQGFQGGMWPQLTGAIF